jgi:hypothetical protein
MDQVKTVSAADAEINSEATGVATEIAAGVTGRANASRADAKHNLHPAPMTTSEFSDLV